MPVPLLHTKLYMPAAGPVRVARPRLITRLEAGWQAGHRLALVSAQAGSGKTTLLADWLSAKPGQVAWLSLDADDNDPARFWAYLAAALQTVRPTLGQTLPAAFSATPRPPTEALLAPLLNELAIAPSRLLLVLDDYHTITHPEVHASLAYLLEHLPPSVQLVVASRADPPWPLGRLRVRGQLTELRAADLRFAPDEAAAFLNGAMGLNLEPADVAALETRTEGWIAGLQLAALALQAAPGGAADLIAAFSGEHHFVLDYLAEEVLSRQPEAVQRFLLQTSILDRLCGDLCDAVTGEAAHTGAAWLAELRRQNLFLISLDTQRQWYRYHHLFADLLRHHLEHAWPAEQVAVLHRRASRWHAERGALEAAVHHALAAHDYAAAAALVEQAAKASMLNGQVATLLRWVEALPSAVREGRPRLQLYTAWVHYLAGQGQAAEQRLQGWRTALAGLPASPENDALRGELATLLARSAAFAGDSARALALAEEALACLPESDQVSRARAVSAQGIAYDLLGQSAPAYAAYRVATELALATDSLFLAAHVLTLEAHSRVHYGHLRQAEQTYRRAIDLGGAGEAELPLAGEAYVGLAEIAFERNDLAAAEHDLAHGLALSQKGGLAGGLTRGRIMEARLRQAQGDFAAAHAALEVVQLRQRQEGSNFGDAQLPLQQASLSLAAGDADAATRHLRALPLTPTGAPADAAFPVVILEVCQVMLARICLAQGQFGEALAVLERVTATAEAAGRQARLIEAGALRAVALARQMQQSPALTALRRALELAQSEGYVRVFIEAGPEMGELLAASRAPGILSMYVDQLLAAFPPLAEPLAPPRQPTQAAAPLIEPLSPRELEVLQLLAEGYSNREIATRLVVTLDAVKKHASHIFGKLGVSRRTQAVARARELGLIH